MLGRASITLVRSRLVSSHCGAVFTLPRRRWTGQGISESALPLAYQQQQQLQPQQAATGSVIDIRADEQDLQSGLEVAVDADAPTPLRAAVRELMLDLRDRTVEQRVNLIAEIAHGTHTRFDRRVLTDGVLAVLSKEFSFKSLKAFSENKMAFDAAQATSPDMFGRFVATGLQRISELGVRDERNLAVALQIYCIGARPSKPATRVVMETMAERLAHSVERARLSTALVRTCMRFLVAVSRSGELAKHRDDWRRMVTAVVDKIGDGVPLLARDVTPAAVEADTEFAVALTNLGMRIELVLEQLLRHLESHVFVGRLTSVAQVARLVHFAARMELPADRMMMAVAEKLDNGAAAADESDQCQAWNVDEASLHDLITLCWAFMARRFEVPARPLAALCERLEDAVHAQPASLPSDCVVELAQLTHRLPEKPAALPHAIIVTLLQRFKHEQRLGYELGKRYPLLRVNEVVDSGFVVAAALVSLTTGELLPWPEKFRCYILRSNHLKLLPGRPVALLTMASNQTLVTQGGEVVPDALLNRQADVMRRYGWLVATVNMVEVQRGDEACLNACREAMIGAVHMHRKVQTARYRKNAAFSRQSKGA